MATYRLRPAEHGDGRFLGDMVVEAANWRPGTAIPRHQVLADPRHARYVAGWLRPGDAGFVAVDDNAQPIGAAWYRMLPRSDPGFGYVGTGVPEMIVGVRPIWRGYGVGRALVRHVIDHARARGFARVSLSVQHGNFAEVLYREEGFVVIDRGDDRDTMIVRLN